MIVSRQSVMSGTEFVGVVPPLKITDGLGWKGGGGNIFEVKFSTVRVGINVFTTRRGFSSRQTNVQSKRFTAPNFLGF